MSDKKFYVVKNNKGEYWDFRDRDGFWKLDYVGCLTTDDEEDAKDVICDHGGHIITLIEEPKKVKLPKKVAEWVDYTKNSGHDITDIFDDFTMPEEVGDWLYDGDVEPHEERGLMLVNAYQYGYTVEKEKKYLVYKELGGKQGKQENEQVAQAYRPEDNPDTVAWVVALSSRMPVLNNALFTELDIEHYKLQDCEKLGVADFGESN